MVFILLKEEKPVHGFDKRWCVYKVTKDDSNKPEWSHSILRQVEEGYEYAFDDAFEGAIEHCRLLKCGLEISRLK
jgi:hypothetical protein